MGSPLASAWSRSLSVFPSCQESLRRGGFRSWTLRPRNTYRWTISKGNPGSQLCMFIHQDVAIDKETERRRYQLDHGWVWHGPAWGTFGGAAMRAADPATRSSCSPMMGWRKIFPIVEKFQCISMYVFYIIHSLKNPNETVIARLSSWKRQCKTRNDSFCKWGERMASNQ